MTGLRDLLKKKDKIARGAPPPQQQQQSSDLNPVPEFKFLRTTTSSQEVIQPPTYEDTDAREEAITEKESYKERASVEKRRVLGFRRSSNYSYTKDPTAQAEEQDGKTLPVRPKQERRLSARLHLHRPRSSSAEPSAHLPDDLPEAPSSVVTPAGTVGDERSVKEQREAQWEKRATFLAQHNPLLEAEFQQLRKDEAHEADGTEKRKSEDRNSIISDAKGDVNIQEAIRLHEIGELRLSTAMFGRLADPHGANNALAQVLYGLALRHGWGYDPAPAQAIHYLSLAASNSANIEAHALASGLHQGGAAKDELVLAIFELANCFRHGWGVKPDPPAARQYYDTAANLGDTDAMDEAAWCYLEGFGGPKDKISNIVQGENPGELGGKTKMHNARSLACLDGMRDAKDPQVETDCPELISTYSSLMMSEEGEFERTGRDFENAVT
nr:hypothetical protein CFP56_09889 [Quercus suber]